MDEFMKRCNALMYITDLSINIFTFAPDFWMAAFEDHNVEGEALRLATGEGKTLEEAVEAAYEDYKNWIGASE